MSRDIRATTRSTTFDPTGLFWKKIVNVFKDVVDDVGDFFEDAFEDIGDFFGEQWDNGNIQKALLGAATIVTAGTFAPIAGAGFAALATGAEGEKLREAALQAQRSRRKGPQELGTLLVGVLAKPGLAADPDAEIEST